MNCNEVQNWILRSEEPSLVPASLSEHLHTCGACRQVQDQLLMVEQHLQAAPLPPVPVQVKSFLLEEMAKDVSPTVAPSKRGSAPFERMVGYVLAIAASLVLGAMLGYGIAVRGTAQVAVLPNNANHVESPENPGPKDPIVEPPLMGSGNPGVTKKDDTPSGANSLETAKPKSIANVPPKSPLAKGKLLGDDELLAKLVEKHLDLASATNAHDRLMRLAALSDLLWVQSIKEAQVGADNHNPWLVEAYAGIVEVELPAIAKQLPADQQAAVAVVAQMLANRSEEVETLVGESPASGAAVLSRLQSAAAKGAERIAGKSDEVAASTLRLSGGSWAFLPLTVEQSIAMARADQAIVRAENAAAFADALAKEIAVTSLQGQESRAAALGQHFGRVLSDGVATNLPQGDAQSAVAAHVLSQAQHSLLFLQQSLEAAPPAAKSGLQQALEESGFASLVPPPGPQRRAWVLELPQLRK